MEREETIQVTIRGWEKYNKRKDIKNPWWFALSNRMLEDPEFYSFSGEEVRAWLYVLSIASQRNSATITINFNQARRSCNVKTDALISIIEKLNNNGVLSKSVRDPYAIRTESVRHTTRQDITEHNKTLQNTLVHSDEWTTDLYALYPKKMGKKKGVAKLKTILKTEPDFQKVKTAIENYMAHLKANKTESKYIKHFDTFVNQWDDWLDPKTGTGLNFKTANQTLTEEDLL